MGELGPPRTPSRGDLVEAWWGAPVPSQAPAIGRCHSFPHPLYSHLLPPAHHQPARVQKNREIYIERDIYMLSVLEEGTEAYSSCRPHIPRLTGQGPGRQHLLVSAHQSHFLTWPLVSYLPAPACQPVLQGQTESSEAASQPCGCYSPSPKQLSWQVFIEPLLSVCQTATMLSKGSAKGLEVRQIEIQVLVLELASSASLGEPLPFLISIASSVQ